MEPNYHEQPTELTLIEGLKEDLAWVAGAGAVALACRFSLGDGYSYLLVLPVLAAAYFAIRTTWWHLTHTPRHRRRTGWKTIFASVAAGVVISVALGLAWDSVRGPGPDPGSSDTPEWLFTTVRNSPLAPPCVSTEDVEYLEAQTQTLEQLGPLLERLKQFFTNPPGGKLDLEDGEWQRRISVVLVDMEELGEDLRNYRPVPGSLEQTHMDMADIGDNITGQVNTLRAALQATYEGNRFAALGHVERYRRSSEAYEELMDAVVDRMAEECEIEIEAP